uniref:CD81 antigen-like n=1 Tax=Myxine glutinosa TaxID=7769 RepID=UPI0035900E0C
MDLLENVDEESSYFFIVLFILIGSAVFTMLACCLCCCGSSKKSRCMLASVFICLLVVFLAEIVFGIWALNNQEQVSKGLKDFYDSIYSEYARTRSTFSKIFVVMIHKMLDCCGSNAFSAAIETLINDVCPNENGFVSYISNALKDCHTRIDQTSSAFIIILGVVVGIFLISGMVFSLCRFCAVRNNQQVVIYQHLVEGNPGNLPATIYSGTSSHVQASFPLNPAVPLTEFN